LPVLGLHSLRKDRAFTVNIGFVPYQSVILALNLQVSRMWRFLPTRDLADRSKDDLEELLLFLEVEDQDRDQDDEVELDIER
jgi:hypothetical protein